MFMSVDPVSILLGILAFIGTKSNQAVDNHYGLQNTRIELMKDMCFIQKDCSALKAFLMPQAQPTNPVQAIQENVLPTDGFLAPINMDPSTIQSTTTDSNSNLPPIIPPNSITAPNPYSGNVVK